MEKTAHTPLLSLAFGLAVLSYALPPVQAQTGEAPHLAPGCTEQNAGVYVCQPEPFRSRLAAAHVVAVQASAIDRYTARELRHLVERLGKQVAQPGQAADLTMIVVPVTVGAISAGPADRPLASLQVFAPGGQAGRGTLVWDETYTGQADRPWAMVVRAVIDQFEEHAPSQHHASRD